MRHFFSVKLSGSIIDILRLEESQRLIYRLEYNQFPVIDKAAALLFFDLAEFFSGLNEFPHKPTRAALRSNSSLWENIFSVLSFHVCRANQHLFVLSSRFHGDRRFSDIQHSRLFLLIFFSMIEQTC